MMNLSAAGIGSLLMDTLNEAMARNARLKHSSVSCLNEIIDEKIANGS